MLQNKVQLITYADSLGSNLKETHTILQKLKPYIGGVHILPFYPSSGDRGFAPLTHLEVDPKFGDWIDIEKVSLDFDLVVDLVVNHISRDSKEFQSFLELGRESEFFDMFLPHDKFDPDGEIDEDVLSLVYTARPKAPYQDISTTNNQTFRLWQTFSNEQIDLDSQSPQVRDLFAKYIRKLSEHGVKMIRLDAIGYVIKKLGTNSFFVEPEIYEFLGWIAEICESNNIELLAEIHKDAIIQQKIADHGHWVYDFCLPILVLHGVYSGDAQYIFKWLQVCPHKQITTLDTHDGLGIVDVEGVLPSEEIEKTKQKLFEMGGNPLKRAFGRGSKNLDVYQINTTYYSALGEDDNAYLLARAIQFFTPGIPQVYYMGLLAQPNNFEKLKQTGHGRDINRSNFSTTQVEDELRKPVVQKLLKLIQFRNQHDSFNGRMEIVPSGGGSTLEINWKNGSKYANLKADLTQKTFQIHHTSNSGAKWEQLYI